MHRLKARRVEPGNDATTIAAGRDHSIVICAVVISLRHFGSSVRTRWLSSFGEPAIDSKYCLSRKFFRTSGSENVFCTSPLILATTSVGMPGGPNSANHEIAL